MKKSGVLGLLGVALGGAAALVGLFEDKANHEEMVQETTDEVLNRLALIAQSENEEEAQQ